MNPGRCGYLGDASRECNKAPRCGQDYAARLSGPLLDRIDLHVGMQPYEPLGYMRDAEGETTEVVRARVEAARAMQSARQDGRKNAEITIEQTGLGGAAAQLAQSVAEKFRFSARGYTRLARVARTVADLADSAEIKPEHVAEAATFRVRFQS